MSGEIIIARVAQTGGYLTSAQVAELASDERTRLHQILVRCGGCRFTCAAQDVAHLISCIKAGGDYVRDVCLPASDPAMRVAVAQHVAEGERTRFSEADCGGVLGADGHVYSDADSGL